MTCPRSGMWSRQAAETAERTSLSVLPVLMLRARKESARKDTNGS